MGVQLAFIAHFHSYFFSLIRLPGCDVEATDWRSREVREMSGVQSSVWMFVCISNAGVESLLARMSVGEGRAGMGCFGEEFKSCLYLFGVICGTAAVGSD